MYRKSKDSKMDSSFPLPLIVFISPLFLFNWGSFMMTCALVPPAYAADSNQESRELREELSSEARQARIAKLLSDGDLYAEFKNYNLAAETYEEVFLLDSKNVEASKRIDILKERMLREGKKETGIVGGVYDVEITARVETYWKQVQEMIQKKEWGSARFTLEKLLLLNPVHEQASALYKKLKQAALQGTDSEPLVENVAHEKRKAF